MSYFGSVQLFLDFFEKLITLGFQNVFQLGLWVFMKDLENYP